MLPLLRLVNCARYLATAFVRSFSRRKSGSKTETGGNVMLYGSTTTILMLYDRDLRRLLCTDRAELLAQEARRGPPEPPCAPEGRRRRNGLRALLARERHAAA